MEIENSLKIIWARHPDLSDSFIDIEVKDSCGNIFEGLLKLKSSQKTGRKE